MPSFFYFYTVSPINIFKWIEDNKALLKPPVSNKQLYQDDHMIVMVVAGPNDRTDYHVNSSSEFFFQIQGSIQLDLQENGQSKSVVVKEGELFLVPAKMPHRPVRPANTVGLVIELVRKNDDLDALEWYCEHCNRLLYQEEFHLQSIEEDLLPVIQRFKDSGIDCACYKY